MPGKAISKGAASVIVDGPGVKGYAKKVSCGTIKRACGRLFGEAWLPEKSSEYWRCLYHGITIKNSSNSEMVSTRVYSGREKRAGEVTQGL